MNGALGHELELQDYTGRGPTWANGKMFGMNHAPGVGMITRPVDEQPSVLPLCKGRNPLDILEHRTYLC